MARSCKWAGVATAAGVLTLTAFGCGGSGSDARDNTGGDRAVGGGPTTVAISINGEPGSLDPLLDADGLRQLFERSVYEGLVLRKAGELVPGLATSWEADGNSWIFHLREGVKFHNGQPVTADDVVASWNRILDERSENLGGYVNEGTTVEAVDPATVKITREEPDPTTPSRATNVMIAPAEYAAVDDDRINTTMVGTGPYKFDKWDRGQRINLSAFDGYWGDKPAIKSAELRFDEEIGVRLAALQSGEIQVAAQMSSDLVSDDFKVVAAPISEIQGLLINNRSGPLQDERLRKAVNLAIDRKTLGDQLFKGFVRPAAGQWVAPYVFGHNPNLQAYEYNPDEARALLEQADAVGTKLSLVSTRGRYSNDIELNEAIASMLNEVGFDVELKSPPWEEYLEGIFTTDPSKHPDMNFGILSTETFDSSKPIGQYLICEGPGSVVCEPEIDELFAGASHETDDAKREALYHQIWQKVRDEARVVSINEVLSIVFTDKNLQWTPEPDGFYRIQDMSFAS